MADLASRNDAATVHHFQKTEETNMLYGFAWVVGLMARHLHRGFGEIQQVTCDV